MVATSTKAKQLIRATITPAFSIHLVIYYYTNFKNLMNVAHVLLFLCLALSNIVAIHAGSATPSIE